MSQKKHTFVTDWVWIEMHNVRLGLWSPGAGDGKLGNRGEVGQNSHF